MPRSMMPVWCSPAWADLAVPGPLFATEVDADLPPPGPPPPDLVPWGAGGLAVVAFCTALAFRRWRAR